MKTDQNPLHDALAELATTMSTNPDRLRQVRQRVDRRRRRRVATGAAVSAGAVAAAVGIAMVPREPRSSLQFNVAGPTLPACASVAAPAAPPTAIKTPSAVVNEPDAVVRYKGMAVVSAAGAGTLTLGNFSQTGGQPPADSVVMVVDSATTFENNGLAGAAADVQVGQLVIFAASLGADGVTHLDHIELGVEAPRPTAEKESAANDEKAAIDDKKAAPDPAASMDEAPSDGVVRGKAVIDAVSGTNEVLVRASMDGHELQPLRLLLGPDTQYFRFETQCSGPQLVAGTTMLFSAVANGDGTYTATEIRTYE